MTANLHWRNAANLQYEILLIMRTFIDSGKPSDCTNVEFADVIINPGEIISMIVTS